MLKILVFDGDGGGEIVSDFLAEELNVVEVNHIIDRSHGSYESKTLSEIQQLTESYLKPHIYQVDLIVLGGYTVSLALQYLQEKYPQQKFVGLSVNYHRILKATNYPIRITVIMNDNLLHSPLCDELRDSLPFSTLAIPDCSGWSGLADKDELSQEIMRTDLAPFFILAPARSPARKPKPPRSPTPTATLLETIMQEKYHSSDSQSECLEPVVVESHYENAERELIPSDAVLILNTCFWHLGREFERVFGYKVRILDFRQKLLHDVCTTLNLLGADGKRSK